MKYNKRHLHEQSMAYRIGFSNARSAAYQYGTTRLSPSMNEREMWSHAWGQFMCGWRAGMRAVSME